IWDSQTGQPVGQPLEGHTQEVNSVAYSPDGRYIVSGSWDKTIRIWDSQTGQPVGHPLQGHTREVNSVAYSPDGRYIVSGSHDKTVRVWDSQIHHHINQYLMRNQNLPDFSENSFSYVSSPTNCPCFIDSNSWLCSLDNPSCLILWIPPDPDLRSRLCNRQVITIPADAENPALAVNWDNFVYGKDWTQV
ncbi:WD40 repeat-like protein, partial [Dendrothele bispora CBS 962.96]